MAKHQLIINALNQEFPLRSEGGELKPTRTLVVNGKGTWAPSDVPEQCMVVAPGDELELVLQVRAVAFLSLRSASEVPLLLPTEQFDSQSRSQRITTMTSISFEVNRAIPPSAGELRYDLLMRLKPHFGGGNADTMVATKP
ncbi:hypothetical protein [Hyalangium gracile]|uniref:hypothetical protein n=1 Tax=Hyalangium gracile TaxID=394092 RepID=UPI001CD00A9E|nr:hypothetical protein [Hyalangium gracile]